MQIVIRKTLSTMYAARFSWIVFLLMLAAPGSVLAVIQQQRADDMVIPGRLYVQYADDNLRFAAGRTGVAAFDRVAGRYNVTAIEKAFPSLDIIATHRSLAPSTEALRRVYVVHYGAVDSPRQVADDFSRVSGVRYAEPMYKMELHGPVFQHGEEAQAIPNDPRYSDQSNLPFMQLEQAWDLVKGSDSTVVIAIVDGGTDWRHEDLVTNIWTNPGETDGDGIDNDNNGYVDDIHGWNFMEDTPDPSGPTPSHDTEHGTVVAGISAATTDNSTGIAGASWNALYMPLNTSCGYGDGTLCYTDQGVVYATLNGADVINCSFGAYYQYFDRVIAGIYQSVTDEGAVIVASAGNTETDNDTLRVFPASFPMVLSVGGVGKHTNDNVYNYGKTVNVFAPGESIPGTAPGNDYVARSGTSVSTPLVSGVAALVKTAFPHFDAHQIREQIRLTAVSIDADNAFPGKYGRGKVDAYAALTSPPQPAIRVTDWSFQNEHGYLDVQRSDTVTLDVTFTNYHGNGNGLSAAMTAANPFIQWETPALSLGNMMKGDSLDAIFRFTFASSAPAAGLLELSPTITAPGFEDSPDLFAIPFAEISVILEVVPISVPEGGGPTEVILSALPNRWLSDSALIPFTVTGSGVEGAVDFWGDSRVDLELVSAQRESIARFMLTPIDDKVDEVDETITISTTHHYMFPQSVTVTLIDDDAPPSGITLSVHPISVYELDDSTSITVTGTVTGGTTYGIAHSIDLTVSGSGNSEVVEFTPVTGVTLSIPAGATRGMTTFALFPVNSADQDADETVTISSTNPLVSNTAKITLHDGYGSAPIALSVDPMSVSEGDGTTTITVTATSATTFADAQVLPITVTGSGVAEAVDFAGVSGFDLSLAANETTVSGTFTLTPTDDQVDERDEILSIISSNTLVRHSATVALLDDDNTPDGVVLSVTPDIIREGDEEVQIAVIATVQGGTQYSTQKQLNITLTGTGVAGAVDYFLPVQQGLFLTVPAEAVSGAADFEIKPLDDEEGEADETITISSDSTFVLSGATLVILDNDGGRTSREPDGEELAFGVAPPYPNPTPGPITFVLSSKEPTDWARLRLYNILGQEVAVPYEGALNAGQRTIRYDGRHLPAGMYVYVFESHDVRVTGQLIVGQ